MTHPVSTHAAAARLRSPPGSTVPYQAISSKGNRRGNICFLQWVCSSLLSWAPLREWEKGSATWEKTYPSQASGSLFPCHPCAMLVMTLQLQRASQHYPPHGGFTDGEEQHQPWFEQEQLQLLNSEPRTQSQSI